MTLALIAPIQVPLINGVVFSFPHIELKVAGLQFTGGFKSVKYKRNRKRTMVMSNSPDPVGKTLGENEYSASIEVYLAWLYALINTIENTFGSGYGDQQFEIDVSYNAPGLGAFQDTILGCTIDQIDVDDKAGGDPLLRTIELNPLKILFNGLDDLSAPLQALPF